MKDFSQNELDNKIQGFMARKMSKFPELQDERYYIEHQAPARRRHSVQMNVFPFMTFGSQS